VTRVLKCTFLACWLMRRFLSSSDGAWHRLPLAPEWRPRSQRLSTSPSLALHKAKGKSGQNQTEKLTNIGTTNTLRKILKDQKARRGKEKVVSKKLQLREPIQRFLITRLALPPFRPLHRFYCLSHKTWGWVGTYRSSVCRIRSNGPFFFPQPLLPRRGS